MKSLQCSQHTFLFTLFMLISVSFAYAQKGTQQPFFQAKSIDNISKKLLEKRFKKHEVFEIPTNELSRFVQQEATPEFELKLGESHSWKMTLFESKLHTENYVTRVLTENGIVTEARQANTVFKGYLNDNPDHEIRLTIADGFMFGFIKDDKYQYYIEPLRNHDKKSNSDHFVLYKSRDVVPVEGAHCGVKDVQSKVAEIHENKSATLACLEVELAQAADYGMYQRYGSSVLNLNLYMDGIMNVTATHFDNEFAEQIILLISERYVVTCDDCDPWTDMLDGETILNDFGNWGSGFGGFSTNPDLTNLWTTRDFTFEGSSSVIGLAWVGAVCASPNSSLVEDFSGTMALMVNLVTHELGHNFGCFHNYQSGDACDGNLGRGPLIMDPFVSFANMWSDGTEPCTLTGGSVTSVNNHVATRNCLSNCSLSATCANIRIDSFDIIGTSAGSINIEWNDLASNYEVRARPSGSLSWTYTNTTSAASETITGLVCNTTYDVQVRADCGSGIYSYPTTAVTQTGGLGFDGLLITNCSAGLYDLQIIVETDNAPAGNTFDVVVDGNTIQQTYTGVNPQTVTISGLIANGNTGISVTVSDGVCSQSGTFDAPQPECFCTPIQSENFNACTLPAGWTNTALGTNPAGVWQFGLTTLGVNTAPGNIDGTCMAFFDDDGFDEDGGEIMILTSPPVDLTAYTNVTLEFDYNFYTDTGGFFSVDVFDGTNWVNVLFDFGPSCGVWGSCTLPHPVISLDPYINPNFQVAFTFDDGGGWQWITAIDNFNVCGFPSECVALNPNFIACLGEQFAYDLTQHDPQVSPTGEDVIWYDGQPSSGTATDLSPANPVDLTAIDELWVQIITKTDSCVDETPVSYLISPDLVITATADTICSSGSTELCVSATLAPSTIDWTDNAGSDLGSGSCITVSPTSNTTYMVAYTDIAGCSDTIVTTIVVSPNDLPATSLDVGICASENITNYNLTQFNNDVTGGTGDPVTWYDGQPSAGGTDITASATSYDLSTMPDIWALVTNSITGCTQEVDINYIIDTAPVLTCPSNIVIDNTSDTCGAIINVPLATAMDDNLTPLTTVQQNIQLDFNGPQTLTFNFDATNIDPTQPVEFLLYVFGNLGGSGVDLSDELNALGTLFTSDCILESGTLTYPPANIAPMLTDGVLTFFTNIPFTTGAICAENYVGITITYTPLNNQFVNITNDYNNGGADASGFYPPGTTTVSYFATDGCGNTDTCSVDITVNQDLPQGEDFYFVACGDLMNFDLSQLNSNFGGTMGTPTTLDWYDGQPSGGGSTLDPPVVDLTSMPDIWILVDDIGAACSEEINILYDLDFPPVITCPTDISVSSDAGVCGATLTLPPLIIMDDSITPLPEEQVFFMPHLINGQALQFDFDGTNVDTAQPAVIDITVIGDTNSGGEYYDIFDENGVFITRIGETGSTCGPLFFTYTIPVADLVSYIADGTITFTAIPASGVGTSFCPTGTDEGVTIDFSYTPFSTQYLTIENDYTNGGVDASGFFPPGTTTITYTVTDGCGNVSTCSTDVTVSPGSTTNFFDIVTNADTICTGGMAELCLNIPSEMPDAIYALDAFDTGFSDIARYLLDTDNGTIALDNTFIGPNIGDRTYSIDLNPLDGIVYLLSRLGFNSSDRQLYTVDLTTGIISNIGQVISSGGNPQPQDMTFDNAGNLYAVFNGGELHTINYTTSPITTNLVATGLPSNGAVGLTYDFDNNRLLYATGNGTVSLYEINTNTLAINLLTTYNTQGNCSGQGIEYIGNNIMYGAGTGGCNEIYSVDLNTFAVTSLLFPTGSYASIKDLMYIPSIASGTVFWTDDMGNQIDTTTCIVVAPSNTTTYTASYTLPNGCLDVSQTTIYTTGSDLPPTSLSVGICEVENIINFDLTQYDAVIATDPNESVSWYIGQPSMGGMDITSTANDTDISANPDIWVQLFNSFTNCTQEVNLIYEIDNTPVITCPANITLNNDPDTCGAFVSIPFATATDDNVTAIPGSQDLRLDYIAGDVPLQFDFDGANIDPNQIVTVTVTAFGNLDSSIEYYEILDEGGNLLTLLNGSFCSPNVFTYTIPAGDLTTFLANNTLTLIAVPSANVIPNCTENYVEIDVSYTSLVPQYVNISNDYNDGGADASGFYLPGTTTVTYVAVDFCGNTDTCTVDITVIQEIVDGGEFSFTACGDLMNYDLTQLDANFGGTMETLTAISWYEGQPSMSGTDITPSADSTDLTGMPDIWVLIADAVTGCLTEVNLSYEFDFPPTITCPTNITVDVEPGTCGANVTIPIATATDDEVTPLPVDQTILIDYTSSGPNLQFDFDGTNIDPTQPATLTITALADMGATSEYFDIFNENGILIGQIGNNVFNDCESETGVFTISVADLATFLADNTITFFATATFDVDAFCIDNQVEMNLSYTPLAVQYITISNDYNDGGADASGYYTSGSTVVTYTATDGCGNMTTCTTTITVNQPPVIGTPYTTTFCGDLTMIDLTVIDPELIVNPDDAVIWFDGQPSAGGTDITANATSYDLSNMPGIWVQVGDALTGCLEDREIIYQLDTPPVLTCPADITVDALPGICGADVTIPPLTFTDDNVTPLPDDQTIFLDYTTDGQTLQFDFDGTNIDSSQPATLTIIVFADMGDPGETFDVFDENGNFIGQIGNNVFTDCQSETLTVTISTADLATFLADNIVTFATTATTAVNPFCGNDNVEMNLTYTPFSTQYVTVANDYNNGGADASDFYPSGTTTVTYTATDGCGNVSTCTVDVIVNQDPIPFTPTAESDILCLGESTSLCVPDVLLGDGQLLGLNFSSPWLGDAFLVSNDLDTVSDDPNFVTPPILPPAPSGGSYTAIDYNPADELYYLLAQNSSGGANLYSVDIVTGATVDFGFISDNINLYARGMTFDNAGNLYLAIVSTLTSPFTTNIEVIPAAMLSNPVPTPTYLTTLLWDNASGMTYNFDNNTIYYAAGSGLYELDLSGNILNGPISYTSPLGCNGQSIEYMGNGIIYGGTCGQIFSLDPTTGSTAALATHSYDFFDLLFVPTTEFTWTDDAGNVVYVGNETCIDVSPDETTTYTATYEADDCFYEGSITINVFDPIANNPVLGFCDYEDISNIDLTIYNTEVNPDNALVEWYDGDPNDNGTLITTPTAIDLNTIGDLWALVTEGGCTASVDVTLIIYATQAVTLNDPADVCEYEAPLLFNATPLPGTFTGDVAAYTSTASDGFTDNGDGTATLDPALAGAGIYDITYTYTNIYGCVTSQTVSVEIFDQPTATANANSIICDGDDIMLSEIGGEATSWTWTTDGTGVFEDANAQQTMVTGAGDGETFTVNVTNDDGCVNSDQITVVFETLSTANDPMLVYCSDEDLTNINLTAYNNNVNAANNGEVISWYDGNPEAGGTLISSPETADLSAVNDLWAAVTDASGCTVVVDVTITINAIPTASIDINTPCEGEDIELSETGNGTSWMWTTNGTATFDDATAPNPTVTDASEGEIFTVTVTNDEGCTNTASVTATFMALPSANDPMLEYCEDEAVSVDLTLEDANVNPNASITWYDGNPNDGGTAIASPDNVNLNTVNDLWALVTDSNACTSTIDISLNIITLPEIVLNNPGNTCVNGRVLVFNVVPLMGTFTSTATAGFTDNNNGTASLNPTLAGAGVYDITFTYVEEGCVREGTVSVEVYDTPAISVGSNVVCGDETLQLSETGGDAVQWYWVSNGNAIFNNNTFQNPTVTNATDGERFTVYVEDENGCESNGQVVISVGTPPTANDPNFAFCANDDISTINLDALSSEVNSTQNGEVVTWYDGNPSASGTVISPPNSVDLNTVDDLWVSVTSSGGCVTTLDVTLTINPAITLTPTVTPPDCNIPNSGSIALGISGGTAPYNYTWSNGTESGNGTGDEINGIVLGLYNIIVTDANGCSESTLIEVQDESCFFTITNNFFASDPCTCNADQIENGAGDGTFEETVTITGPRGIIIRASAASTGLDIPVPADFYESFPGRYRLEFNHVDRIGYVLYIEFSTDGGMTFSPATDMNGMQLSISNVCAYPVLDFSPPLIEFCETEPAFPINAIEISPDVDFIPVEGYPSISINTGIQYPAPITFDPAGLGGSVYTFTGFYDYEPGTGMGGTLAAPAIALNACPTYIRINVPISQEPIGSAICGPAADPNEVIIDVDAYEDYLTPENLMYRVNGGPFQTSDKFIVNGEDVYNMTIMDAVTACSFDFQLNCLLVLPIELVFFNAHCDDDAYLLTWQTASESNVAEFIVERSANGETFSSVGKVAAVGESTTPQYYQYKDDTKAGRYYYRLRIVENDGKTMYSDVQVIECLKGVFDIVDVFPNPTEDELSILFESVNTDAINFKLTDLLGRTIMEDDMTPQIGLNTKVIDLSNLPSAMYFVVLNDGKVIRKVVRK